MDSRGWVRVVIALSTIPIAIVANGVRVAGTGVAAHYYGREAAEGFFHTFSGWLVFVVAFVMMFALLHALLRRLSPPPGSANDLSAGRGVTSASRSILLGAVPGHMGVRWRRPSRAEPTPIREPLTEPAADDSAIGAGARAATSSPRSSPCSASTTTPTGATTRRTRRRLGLYVGYYRSQRRATRFTRR